MNGGPTASTMPPDAGEEVSEAPLVSRVLIWRACSHGPSCVVVVIRCHCAISPRRSALEPRVGRTSLGPDFSLAEIVANMAGVYRDADHHIHRLPRHGVERAKRD